MPPKVRTGWQVVRPLIAPLALCVVVVLILREPLAWWLHGEEKYDQEAIKEWIREAGNPKPLKQLARAYLDQVRELREAENHGGPAKIGGLHLLADVKRQEVQVHLHALGNVLNQLSAQLPLFPVVYQMTVEFDSSLNVAPIVWDSHRPRQESQFQTFIREPVDDKGTSVSIQYHLHAYTQQQYKERQEATRRLWLSGLGIFFVLLALSWIYVAQRRERERQKQSDLVEQQMAQAQQLRLEEELRRRDAEQRSQEAERQALELKSQLFANIGIMAGSYAHNIKNLLVRPNDLLRRCLEEKPDGGDQANMLHEVKQTLGTVTERLQQILQTVRRDPSESETVRIDLNALVVEMQRTWADLAREKWKCAIEVDLYRKPLWIEGDVSHLQQALENLLFNARDATFEMRNHLREEARRGNGDEILNAPSPPGTPGGEGRGEGGGTPHALTPSPQPSPPEYRGRGGIADRRQALISAAGWKGAITLRTRRDSDTAILEVQDNGIGMTDEVRRRSTETHFSTKRNNALFAGLSAGMGLGLSFVTVILGHHRARLDIDSEPLKGATFRIRFPLAANS